MATINYTDSILRRHNKEAKTESLIVGDSRTLSGETLFSVKNIDLSFKGVKAITDISFDVAEGEICALIGPNGAGKSSMLNVINGVYRPQKGSISYGPYTYRKTTAGASARRGIARTFQNIALFQGMTTLENIMTGRNLKMKATVLEQVFYFGRPHREEMFHRRKVEEVIEFLQIQNIRNTPVNKLPYGLQKRVELGRAMAMEPKLLLLDEPMAGMTLEEKQDMACFIIEINREYGTTTVLIEHDMSVVMDISDHIVVMDYGKKIGDGSPEEMKNKPEVIDAYLGTRHE